MPFAVAIFNGREPEPIRGPFPTEQDAVDWCAEEGIEIDSHVRDDDRRRGFVLPFNPPRT